ncbi:MAG: BatD family protein, partial [Nitrospinota bacterium]|nr:BatD family protein [Nitrospinota bacterium]
MRWTLPLFLALAPVCLLLAPGRAFAASDIKVSAAASAQTVPPGALFQYTVTVEGAGLTSLPEPTKPDFGAMKAVGQSSSQSVSIVNMSMKISKTITYQLIAPDEG